MEVTKALNRYKDFIQEHHDMIEVFVGQSTDASLTHINIYPAQFNYSYERNDYQIVVELALPGIEITDAVITADEVAATIELDALDDLRLSNYNTEFYFNEQIAGTVILFIVNLFIQECR